VAPPSSCGMPRQHRLRGGRDASKA
jgi:hypothetical protein